MKRFLVFVAAAALILSAGSTCFAQGYGMTGQGYGMMGQGYGQGYGMMGQGYGPGSGYGQGRGYGSDSCQALDRLSPEQQKEAEDMWFEHKQKTDRLMNELWLREAELDNMMMGRNPKQGDIEQKMEQISDLEVKLNQERLEFRNKMSDKFGEQAAQCYDFYCTGCRWGGYCPNCGRGWGRGWMMGPGGQGGYGGHMGPGMGYGGRMYNY